ncbi:MAG: ParB/RepB/Spo0J family partition protein [Alphaproteobacteria bacterium]
MMDVDMDIESKEEETGGLGLGRGLNALFDDEEVGSVVSQIEEKVQKEGPSVRARHMVGVEQLAPSKFQPRKKFKEESLQELANSIKEHGVLQPLLVRENPDQADHYEIIAGERRWRASQKAQLHEVPVILLELDELEAFKIALIENLQREDLDPIDEALGYQKLLDDYNQTQEELAKAVGKSRPHITNTVRLLTLPEDVQDYVSTGDLSMGHARALITAQDPSALAKQVIAKGLSVRQTEKFAAEKKGTVQKKRAAKKDAAPEKDTDTIALENDISNALGMRVTIDSADGKSGKLAVEFTSLDQLDELLHRLAHFPSSRLNG